MGVPLLSVIGVVIAAVATILTVIGLGTTGWIVANTVGLGLFKICVATVCSDIVDLAASLQATRAMVIIGALLGVVCVVVLVVYIIKKDKKILQLLGMVLAFVAACFLFVGVIIYGVEFTKLPFIDIGLGYSFALTVVGAVFFLIAGIILVVEKFVKGSESKVMQG